MHTMYGENFTLKVYQVQLTASNTFKTMEGPKRKLGLVKLHWK